MRACEQSELRSLDRSPIRLQQLVPLERLQLALEGLVAPPVQRPVQVEQQVQVPLGELQQELGE